MTSPLFRPEALAGASLRGQGEIAVFLPLSYRLLGLAVLLVVSIVVVFLACASMTRKVTTTGVLTPEQGQFPLTAMQAGIVLQAPQQEGLAVNQGDVLFVISPERPSAARTGSHESRVAERLAARGQALDQETREQVALLQAETDRQQQRLARMNAEAAPLEREVQLMAKRVTLAEQSLNRHRELARNGFVTESALQLREAEWLELRGKAETLARERSRLQREADGIAAELAAQPLRLAQLRSQATQRRARLAQEEAEQDGRRELAVRAPLAGRLFALQVRPGHAVTAGQPLAMLLPADGRLEAELRVPSRAVGFVEPGQRVLIRYGAYAWQKFGHYGGIVREVAGVGMASPHSAGTDPFYRVRVRLDRQDVSVYGASRALAPGLALEADVLLERRRLLEWVFEPLLSLRGRVAPAAAEAGR